MEHPLEKSDGRRSVSEGGESIESGLRRPSSTKTMQEVLPWIDTVPPLPEETESIHSEASFKPPGSPASSGIIGKFRREEKKKSQDSVQDNNLADVLKKIAQQRGWSQAELNQDLQTLQKQRLRTVEDAKLLQPLSWNELGLLPLVRDLLKRELKL